MKSVKVLWDKYENSNHFFLGMWIRNEFCLKEKINSKLVYECYISEYNNKEIGKMGPLWMVDASSPVILKKLWVEVQTMIKLKNTN